ncbi:sensor histidine kinase [Labedella endophytica]|uniref:histidine kinase n=1 Tax=Labedella endophytica TaxID=1523160 RepID=A0A3S0VIS9_9MICO|nr:ATP-binding protein [Labedella endophytica]RUR03570.1 sensor histidine kinase [Labedella endophytica]
MTEAVPELELIRHRDVFWRGQSPFLAGALVLFALVALCIPGAVAHPLFLTGVAVTVVSTVLVFLVPWNALPVEAVVIIPLLDIVAVAILRESLYETLPSAGFLIIFPVVWLSYRFPFGAILLSVTGALLVTALPILVGRPAPSTGREWVELFLLPALVSIVAVMVFGAAQLLRATRAQADRVLQEAVQAEILARTVADSVDASIVHFRPDGTVGLRNHAANEQAILAGYDQSMHAATAAYDVDRRTPIPTERQSLHRALNGEEFRGDLFWIGVPGEQRAIAANSSRVQTADGDFLGTVLVGHDVTDLANAVAVREEFLVAVSHELRTPLTSIIGYLDILADTHDLEAIGMSREVSTIQRNADQLHAIISDLLTANANEIRVRPGPVDVANIVRECADTVLPRATALGIEVTVDAPHRFDVEIDASRIGQVIDNLLSNGLKYTPAGGRVALSLETGAESGTEAGGREFSVVVSDTGIGISREDQRQLFDRFFRAQEVRDRATQGLGLGLSIVRTIVDAHGGRIEVASRLGHGSRFAIVLPVRQPRTR